MPIRDIFVNLVEGTYGKSHDLLSQNKEDKLEIYEALDRSLEKCVFKSNNIALSYASVTHFSY